MLGPRITDEVVMRYADGELPWFLRIPLGTALLLSPRLRQRIREARRLSATLRELGAGFASVSVRPTARRPFSEADYLFSEPRKHAHRVHTTALRWVIVVAVLVALYFFAIVSSAF